MEWLPVEGTAEWLRDFGVWAVLISLLLNIIISIFGVIPTVFLSGANAVVFGFVPGFWISLTGEVLGAGLSYWIYRWGFRKTKMKQENWLWLQKLKARSRGRQIMILLLARVTPLIPSGIITFIAAIAYIRFMDFIVVTIVGKMPSIAMETLVGHDLLTMNENLPRLLISLFLLLLIYLLFKKRGKRESDQT